MHDVLRDEEKCREMRPFSPTTQAEREKASHTDLAPLIGPLAAYLPELLKPKSRGNPEVSNAHRALLSELPYSDLATAVLRTVLTRLLTWKRKKDATDDDDDK